MGIEDTNSLTPQGKEEYFRSSIKSWYEKNGRKSLPWRLKSTSQFHKLVAEVLLQKTDAESVAKLYPRITAAYPDVDALAAEDPGRLEAILKPIGLYKKRARVLVGIARAIRERGTIPDRESELLEMPGIGLYIARAYLVSSKGARVPIVDTNVGRVIGRFFGLKTGRDPRRDSATWDFVSSLLPRDGHVEFLWGILDFAGAICKSRRPLCGVCVLKERCSFATSCGRGSTMSLSGLGVRSA